MFEFDSKILSLENVWKIYANADFNFLKQTHNTYTDSTRFQSPDAVVLKLCRVYRMFLEFFTYLALVLDIQGFGDLYVED
jgi:hypothetical protein